MIWSGRQLVRLCWCLMICVCSPSHHTVQSPSAQTLLLVWSVAVELNLEHASNHTPCVLTNRNRNSIIHNSIHTTTRQTVIHIWQLRPTSRHTAKRHRVPIAIPIDDALLRIYVIFIIDANGGDKCAEECASGHEATWADGYLCQYLTYYALAKAFEHTQKIPLRW